MRSMLKSKKFWGILVSVFFLWLALQKVEWKAIPDILSRLQYQYIVLMIFSITCEHLVRAARWRLILFDRPLTFSKSYFGLLLGYLFNNLLPARGGEFLRAIYIKRKEIAPASEAFGSIVFERFLDGLVIVTIIVFSLNKYPTSANIQKAGVSAIVFYAIVLLGILLLEFRKPLFLKITNFILNLFPKVIADKLSGIRDSFVDGLKLIGDPLRFAKALIVSFIAWAFSILTMFLCIKLFALPFGIMEAILLIAILSVGAMIPSSPGMIGIYEFCCVVVLTNILHQPKELSAVFGMISHSLAYIYILIAGFSILTIEGIKFSDFQKKALEHEQEEIQ